MTIIEAINKADKLRQGNAVSEKEKIYYLSVLDGIIKQDVIDTHLNGETITFNGYDETVSVDTELLVKEPHSQIYPLYLATQISLVQGETDKYNIAMTQFNSAYLKFTDWYNRTHKPSGRTNFIF